MIDSLSFSKIMMTLGAVICPFLLIALLIWFLRLAIITVKEKIIKYQQWRTTPCPNCIYFVDRSELKCAVRPCEVLTKNAVGCRDFQAIVGTRIYDYGITKSYHG